MSVTSIEWTDRTWNPVRGCSRISEGCRNCYAERVAARFSGPGGKFEGFATSRRERLTGRLVPGTEEAERSVSVGARWTGKVELIPEKLAEPLSWRKPQRVFVNSMSDLFHEELSNEDIAAVFGAMAASPDQTFQVLTKRADRLPLWFEWLEGDRNKSRFRYPELIEHAGTVAQGAAKGRLFDAANRAAGRNFWPLPNVWLGVSVEHQAAAETRIPFLLQTPAHRRFVSYEPALGPVDFTRINAGPRGEFIDWIIVGGESGPRARAFHVAWGRDVLRQNLERGSGRTKVFVKQMGSNVRDRNDRLATDRPAPDRQWWPEPEEGWHDGNVEHNPNGYREEYQGAPVRIRLKSPKGGDPTEWPEDLRVREFPA